MTRSAIAVLGLMCVVVVLLGTQAFAYPPDELPAGDRAAWQAMSGREAGRALLALRARGATSDFASHFLLYLDQGRTTRAILDPLRVVGLPLQDAEVEEIGDILSGGLSGDDVPTDVRFRNAVEHGYTLECHATPGTRISLIFLNADERAMFKKHYVGGQPAASPREENILANLEGRMCVWAAHRKIHLGGPHFVYERVARILSRRSPDD